MGQKKQSPKQSFNQPLEKATPTPSWPKTEYETLPWKRNPEELEFVPKSRRRKILSEYQAALPPHIAKLDLQLPPSLTAHLGDLEVSLTRFDAISTTKGYNLPALLLRSESSSSSQIERLTSSVRNVAMAELTNEVPANALLIANNVAAMRKAFETSDELSIQTIEEVHAALMGETHSSMRKEQVWIGGTSYSPHGARYIPPHYERVQEYLEDLCSYAQRDDIPAIVRAAIVHAQFESIHPFTDGNGRTGRTLLHKMLRREGIITSMALPLSAGLLHEVDLYMEALDAYQKGNPYQIIERVADALEFALQLGSEAMRTVDDILETWNGLIHEKAGSSIHKLPALLVEHPVVNVELIVRELGITSRAANNLINRATEYGVVRKIGTRRRGVFYQADELIDLMEQLSSRESLRRSSM